MTTELRVPPQNTDAEQALLGACFINPSIIPSIDLPPEAFYKEAHQHIFKALQDRKDKADLVTVGQWLKEKDLLEKCGGMDYLVSLEDCVPTSAGWRTHREIIDKAHKERQFVAACALAQEKLYNHQGTLGDISSTLQSELVNIEIGDPFSQKTGVDIANVYDAERCLESYREYIKTLKQNRFITGIHEIDKRIRGVSGGEVLFILARGGTFKTAILQNLLKNYVNNSAWGATFFSIEMPVASLTERYHEIVQGSPGKDIEDYYTADFGEAGTYLEGLEKEFKAELRNLFIVDANVSVKDIIAYVHLIQHKKDIKIGVIGIDYLGLMEGEGRGEYEIISGLAKNMKNLARTLNIPVVVIGQTSRKAGSGDMEITLDMGRGSGVIEEAADVMLGLWQQDRELICKILKNRKGPKNSRWIIDLDPENLRLGESARKWEPKKKGSGIEA